MSRLCQLILRRLSTDLDLARLAQTTLDDAITRHPRPPAFTTDGLLDYIIELVVSEDEVRDLRGHDVCFHSESFNLGIPADR